MFGPLPDDFMEQPAAKIVRYRKTRFGVEVFAAARDEMGFFNAFSKWISTDAGQRWLAQQTAKTEPRPPSGA